jgi:pyruvate dehydrogenase E2 component (dihydrolipoamide acetyltransferase)
MIDFLLPSLGADMDRAMLLTWLVEPGDEVTQGQVIAEVETEKGVIEVECWENGVIEEIIVQPGPEKLPVGTVLARIRGGEEPTSTKSPEPAVASAPEDTRPPRSAHGPTPPLRHLAHTLGVDLDAVVGTGPEGAVTREDLVMAKPRSHEPVVPIVPESPSNGRVKASPRARALAGQLGVDLTAITPTRDDHMITYDDVAAVVPTVEESPDRATAMRQAITRSMSRSKREIPHYYLATRIDMSRALLWLDELNSERPITRRILPAVLMLKATALAAREVTDLNGHWIDERFVPADPVHLGVAISLREGGLVAPAIHYADTLALDELMGRLRDLVTRARSWRLRSSEMSDPTITVTNLGDRGAEVGFPIIIPPQVAMVGFGRIVDEVVAEGGNPAVHPVVHATLAADHRVTDGHTGGVFLSALGRLLEKPEEL